MFDKIKYMKISDEIFVPVFINYENLPSTVWDFDTQSKKIRFKLKVYNWVCEFFKTFKFIKDQKIIEKKNFLEIEGYTSNVNEIVPYLLKFIDCIKIEENEELKKELVKRT